MGAIPHHLHPPLLLNSHSQRRPDGSTDKDGRREETLEEGHVNGGRIIKQSAGNERVRHSRHNARVVSDNRTSKQIHKT